MKPLTRRQRQVLLLAAGGCSNAQIAERLGNSAHSVAEVLSTAYRRLGASDRAHAVALAIHAGEISLGDLSRIADAAASRRRSGPLEAVCGSVAAELPACGAPDARGAAGPSEEAA